MSEFSRWAEIRDEMDRMRTGADLRETSKPCEVHRIHNPRSHINEQHHVWPLGHGGPDIAENVIIVCATGHNSLHSLLAEYLMRKGDVPWSLRQLYSPDERKYAELGYQRITRQAM